MPDKKIKPFNNRDIINRTPLTSQQGLGYATDSKYKSNTEEGRALEQGFWDSTGNILGRFLGRTALGVTETAGMLGYGVPSAITSMAQGKPVMDSLSLIFDNEFTDKMKILDDKLREVTPFYQTKEEKESSALSLTNLSSANFWGNVIGEGGGFVASAFVGGSLISKGISILGKTANTLGKLATRADKVDEVVNALQKGTANSSWLKNLYKGTKYENAASFYAAKVGGNLYEAGVEAKGIKDAIVARKEEEFKSNNPGVPITKEMRDQWESQANPYANVGMALNLALLQIDGTGLSKFLKGYKNTQRTVNALRQGDKYIEKGIKGKIVDRFKTLTKGGASEALQEGGQFTVEKGLEEQELSSDNSLKQYFLSTIKGLEETLGTKEGQESMIAGFLLASPGGIYNAIKEGSLDKDGIAVLNSVSANKTFTSLFNNLKEEVDNNTGEKKEKYAENNANYLFKNNQDKSYLRYLSTRQEAGRFEDVFDDLDEAEQLDLDVFNEVYNTDYTQEQRLENIRNLKEQAKRFNKISNEIETVFSQNKNKKTISDYSFLLNQAENRHKELSSKILNSTPVIADKLALDIKLLEKDIFNYKQTLAALISSKPIPTSADTYKEDEVITPEGTTGVVEGELPKQATQTKDDLETEIPDNFNSNLDKDTLDDIEAALEKAQRERESKQLVVSTPEGPKKVTPNEVQQGEVEDSEPIEESPEESDNYSMDQSLAEDAPGKSMVIGDEYLNYSDLGIRDFLNMYNNASEDRKESFGKFIPEYTEAVNSIINSKEPIEATGRIIARREKENPDNLQVYYKTKDKEYKIGYFLNFKNKARKSERSIGDFLAQYLNIIASDKNREKKFNTLNNIIGGFTKLFSSTEEVDITPHTYLRTEIAKGETSLDEAMKKNSDRWTLNGQTVILKYNKGTYSAATSLNKKNREIVKNLNNSLFLNRTAPYLIVVKRPDSNTYTILDIKTKKLAESDIKSIMDRINNTEPSLMKNLVADLNKEVFLQANKNYAFKTGELKDKTLPIHIQLGYDSKKNEVFVGVEFKLVDGKLPNGIDPKLANKYGKSYKIPVEQALREYGVYKFDMKDELEGFEKNLPNFKVNTTPEIWKPIFSFSAQSFNENYTPTISTPTEVPIPETPQVSKPKAEFTQEELDEFDRKKREREEADKKATEDFFLKNNSKTIIATKEEFDKISNEILSMIGVPVKLYNSSLAYGEFIKGVIYLNREGFPTGTQYHEAFHAVFEILSPEEKLRVLNIARNNYKLDESYVARLNAAYKQKNINLTRKQLEDIYYEEVVAELFREYMNNRPTGILQVFFEKLKRLIKYLFNKQDDVLFQSLFEKIRSGEFKYNNRENATTRFLLKGASVNESEDTVKLILTSYLNRNNDDIKVYLEDTFGESPSPKLGVFVRQQVNALQNIFTQEFFADQETKDKTELEGLYPPHKFTYERQDGKLVKVYPSYLDNENIDAITNAVKIRGRLRETAEQAEIDLEEESERTFNGPEMEKSPSVDKASRNLKASLSTMYYMDDKGRPKIIDDIGIYNNLLFNLGKVRRPEFKSILERLSSHNTDYGKSIKVILDRYNSDKFFESQLNTTFDKIFVKAFKTYDKGREGNTVTVENFKNHIKKQLDTWLVQSTNYIITKENINNGDLTKILNIDLAPEIDNDAANPDFTEFLKVWELIETKVSSYEGKEANKFIKDNKDLFTKLADFNVAYRTDLGDLNFKNAEGKNMYSMMNRSFILNKLEELSKVEKFDWGIYIGSEFGFNKTTYKSQNYKEYIYSQISNYLNVENKKDTPLYYIQQFEAKSTNLVFKGKKHETNYEYFLNFLQKEKARQEAWTESQRVELLKPISEQIEGYHYIKGLDTNELEERYKRGEITRGELPRMFHYFNIPFANDKKVNEEFFTKEEFDEFLKQEYQNLDIQLAEIGETYDNIKGFFNLGKKEDFYLELTINQFLNSAELMSKILPDFNMFKDFVDVTKRGGGLLASGPSHGEGEFKFGIFEDIEYEALVGHKVEDTKDNRRKINSTDAQGVESISERLNRYERLGVVNSIKQSANEKNDKAFLGYKYLKALEQDDRKFIESYVDEDALLKVDKTVGYDENFYIKTSVTVLTRYSTSVPVSKDTPGAVLDTKNGKYYLPIKGKETIFNLLNKMQREDVSAIFAKSAIKKGARNVSDVASNDLPFNSFKYDDYRLQQENPSGKDKILDGSQLIQLIEAYLPDTFMLDGKTREDIVKALDEKITQLKEYGNEWFQEIGQLSYTLPNGEIYNPFYDYLKSNLEGTAGNERISEFFGIKDGQLINSPNMPMMKIKFEELLMAYYNNNIAKHKTPGGKYTLVSDMFYEAKYDKNGRILTDYEYLQLSKEDQKNVTTSKLKWAEGDNKYAQIVLSEEYLHQMGLTIKDWVRLKNSKPYTDEYEIFNKIRYALGYRIPTQSQHSMVPVEIIDFLPMSHGSTVIAPSKITAISGADYDVDSLFIHKYGVYKDENGKLKLYEATQESYKKSLFNNKILKEFFENIPNEEADKLDVEILNKKRAKRLALKDSNYEEVDILNTEINNLQSRVKSLRELDALNFIVTKLGKNFVYSENTIVPEVIINEMLDIRLGILTSEEGLDLLNKPAEDLYKPLYKNVFSKLEGKDKAKQFSVYSSFTNRNNEWYKIATGGASIGPAANENKIAAFFQKNDINLASHVNAILNDYIPYINFNTTAIDEQDINLVVDEKNKQLTFNLEPSTNPGKYESLSNNVSITVDNAKDQTLVLYHLNDANMGEASVFNMIGFGRNRTALLLLSPIAKRISSYLSIPTGNVNEVSPYMTNDEKIKEFLDKYAGKTIELTDEFLIESYNKRVEIEKLLDAKPENFTEEQERLLAVQYTIGKFYETVSTITQDTFAVNTILNINKEFGKSGKALFKIQSAYNRIEDPSFSFNSTKMVGTKFYQKTKEIVNQLVYQLDKQILAYNQSFHNLIKPLTYTIESDDPIKDQSNNIDLANKFIEYITIRKYAETHPTFDITNEDVISGKKLIELYNKHITKISKNPAGKLLEILKPTDSYPFTRIGVDTFNNLTPELKQNMIDGMISLTRDPDTKEFVNALVEHMAAHDNFRYIKGSTSILFGPAFFNRLNLIYKDLEKIQNESQLAVFIGGEEINKLLEKDAMNLRVSEYEFKEAITPTLVDFAQHYFTDKRNLRLLNDPSFFISTYTKEGEDKIDNIALEYRKESNKDIIVDYVLGPSQKINYPLAFREGNFLYTLKAKTDNQLVYEFVQRTLGVSFFNPNLGLFGENDYKDPAVKLLQLPYKESKALVEKASKELEDSRKLDKKESSTPTQNPEEYMAPNIDDVPTDLLTFDPDSYNFDPDATNINFIDNFAVPSNIDDLLENNIKGFNQTNTTESSEQIYPNLPKTMLKEEIRPGVIELFEENPDFSSQIYEALGFNNDNIELKPYATDVWGKVPQQRGDNSFVSKEQYSIKLGEDKGIDIRLTIYFDDINKTAFVSNIENFENDRIHPLKKGLGLKGFLKANQLIISRGYTPTVDTLVSGYGYDMLSKLEKNGYLTKVLDKKAVDSQYDNIKYEKSPFIFTNKIYEYGLIQEQKQQAQQLYSQYLEQNPNGNVEQFKSWVDEFNRKTNIQGAYDFGASSNSGKWNSANNELLSLVQDNRKAFAIYKFLIGDMETFKEIVDFLNEKGIEIPYTDRMKRADETMTAEERKSAIDSYNNSVDSKVEDKAQVEKDILSENNLQDETEYTPQELIEKYPLTGVQKVIWNLIKDIVNKLGIKVKFSSGRITEGFDGSNNPQNGEILIRPSTLKSGKFGEVLVHEVVHALTTKIISRVNSGVTTGLTQKQINAVKGLMKLFEAVKADNNLENKYPVKDVFEFIAHLTNEAFVKELESKNKNFLQKVVDFILDIFGITNANELSKKYLIDIISDGVFLQENGITVLPSDYGSNIQGSLSDFITQKSQERLKAIQEVFNSNPELSKIGDVFSYAIYLDTIFPDSKVKDIVYRGSERGIENDNRAYLYFTSNKNEANIYAKTNFTKGGNINERNPIPSISKNIGEYIDNKYGKNSFKSLNADKQDFYEQVSENDYELRLPEWYKEVELSNEDKSLLKDFKDLKQMYDIVKIESEEDLMKQYDDTNYQNTKPKYDKLRNKLSPFFNQEQIGKVEPVILNIQNPYTEEIVQEDLQNNRDAYKNGHDGAFLMDGDHFVVKKSSEQIHILGSKQDIENFAKFVNKEVSLPEDLIKAQEIDPSITPEVWNSMNEEEKENWFKCNKK